MQTLIIIAFEVIKKKDNIFLSLSYEPNGMHLRTSWNLCSLANYILLKWNCSIAYIFQCYYWLMLSHVFTLYVVYKAYVGFSEFLLAVNVVLWASRLGFIYPLKPWILSKVVSRTIIYIIIINRTSYWPVLLK